MPNQTSSTRNGTTASRGTIVRSASLLPEPVTPTMSPCGPTPPRAAAEGGGATIGDVGAGLAFFFALHYGIFTFVHGIFAFVMAFLAGGSLHPVTWLLTGLVLVLSHLGSLWINWYAEGERFRVSPGSAMWQPYPRMLVLHVGILVGFGLVLDWLSRDPGTGAILLDIRTIRDRRR